MCKKWTDKFGIFNDVGMKLIALGIAVISWLMVTNVNDPMTYKTFSNVQVQIIHGDMITDKNQVYSVLDGSDVVQTVTVGAPRSIADSLTRENLVAVADVEHITQLGTVPISFSTNLYNDEINSISGTPDSVKLSIEKRKSSSFTLQTTTSGAPANGYSVSSVVPEQNQIRVSGPESVVSGSGALPPTWWSAESAAPSRRIPTSFCTMRKTGWWI